MAANRSTWVSATEYAIFILTGASHYSSHNEVPLFLSRAWYTMHACKRLLEGSAHGYLAETAHVPVSAIAFSMPSATQLPINEDTSDAAEPAEGGASQPAAILDAGDADDDDAAEGDEEEPGVDKDASEQEEEMIMRELKTTSTRIDDWLHRGPFLHDFTLVSYIRHISRVKQRRIPVEG